MLLSRHGECAPIDALSRRVPEAAGVSNPHAFVKAMRDRGFAVSVDEPAEAKGRFVEVRVPARDLALVFVPVEHCKQILQR